MQRPKVLLTIDLPFFTRDYLGTPLQISGALVRASERSVSQWRRGLEKGWERHEGSAGADADDDNTKAHHPSQVLRLGDGNGSGAAGFMHGRSPTLFFSRPAGCGSA